MRSILKFVLLLGVVLATVLPAAAQCLEGASGPNCTFPSTPATIEDLGECYSGRGDSRIVPIVDQPVTIRFTKTTGNKFDMVFEKLAGHTGGPTVFYGGGHVNNNGQFVAKAVCDTAGCDSERPVVLQLRGWLSFGGDVIHADLFATGCFSNGIEPDACVYPELAFLTVQEDFCPED